MQVKRYEATNLQEVMVRIKKDLGPNAIILSTGKISDRPHLIEVLAARDEQTAPPVFQKAQAPPKELRLPEPPSGLEKEIQELRSGVEGLKQQLPSRRDLSEFRETMDILLDAISTRYPAHLRSIYTGMITGGISRNKAAALLESIKKDYAQEERDTFEKSAALAQKLIARSLTKTGPKERRIKALIGPTGVGKTTTLAKLAAHYSLEKKMKVGMITTDTYRIAAAEQLKVYAKIMGLPLQVAPEKESFLRSLESFAEKEVILVDTPGRNHNDDGGLNELRAVLDPAVETVLLLSPAASRQHLLETANRFKVFDYDRIILTKVDECSHFGSMYEVLDEIGKPVSHVTTGQNVPRDIEKASPESLARLILHNSMNQIQLRG
ncbi:MAG: flagellar biosynthesis protein FlhF [Deltaproteobacteria bacterium]|nr:flagellar biosynthesis protein FlhF [Deltaproteobacteria bacterium]